MATKIQLDNELCPTGIKDNGLNVGMGINPFSNYWCQHAYNVISDSYGDTVRVKPKNLLKFGRTTNADANTKTTIMTFLTSTTYNESYLSDQTTSANLINMMVFDTSTANQNITIEGHYWNNSVSGYVFSAQSVNANGTTGVTLTTSLARATRAYNNGSTELNGNCYVYEDHTITAGVPSDSSKVHLIIVNGSQQSEKASTAFSSQDYGLVTSAYAVASRNAGATVNVDIDIEVRELGKVFRPITEWTIRTSADSELIKFEPYLIVPKNSDIRMVATSNTNDTTVVGWFNSLIAIVQ